MTPAEAYEFILLALTIWREARGESFLAKLGVAWTIRNRVLTPGKTWWGDDWEDVVLKKAQFSSFNPTDPNAVKWPRPDDPSWVESLDVAERTYRGQSNDPTGGANHYHDISIPPPVWAHKAKMTARIGNFKFYRV